MPVLVRIHSLTSKSFRFLSTNEFSESHDTQNCKGRRVLQGERLKSLLSKPHTVQSAQYSPVHCEMLVAPATTTPPTFTVV